MKKTNYSYETSLPAYEENSVVKEVQKDVVYSLVMQAGKTCLKSLEKITGLPQSTISGRINDLIKDNKVKYDGKGIMEEKKRKIITTTA